MIKLLDYGAGNIRSVINAVKQLGYEIDVVRTPQEILSADQLIFPGVGNFGVVMERLNNNGFIEPLLQRIEGNKPLLGICVALQTFFERSEEAPGKKGLGIIPGMIKKFDHKKLSVPQIGWNGISFHKDSPLFSGYQGGKFYFVHSYYAEMAANTSDWLLTSTDYGCKFVSSVERGNIAALQFHPEKSGQEGLQVLENFLTKNRQTERIQISSTPKKTQRAKRVVACLDVRSNDEGDLVVTKGDQYDVREKGQVRNLGLPVSLAKRYYNEGADEITFLNITGYRDFPLQDQPMLDVLKKTSEHVFVPLTIGGGIQEFTDSNGTYHQALDVASAYFRAGADKVSLGSDAVYIVEKYFENQEITGKSSIEQISAVYGAQAVVISVDPRRVYVEGPEDTQHAVIRTEYPGPEGEEYCWYQCTVKGGREGRDIDVIQLVTTCELLGAGEILLNCIDKDGTNSGFDIELITHVKEAVTIPIIASSGAGSSRHFCDVFEKTDVEAALAAGIFHRREVSIEDVKKQMRRSLIETR